MTKIQFNDTYITVIPSYEQTREHSHSMLHVFFFKSIIEAVSRGYDREKTKQFVNLLSVYHTGGLQMLAAAQKMK